MALNEESGEIVIDGITEGQVVKIIVQVDGVEQGNKSITVSGLEASQNARAVGKVFINDKEI